MTILAKPGNDIASIKQQSQEQQAAEKARVRTNRLCLLFSPGLYMATYYFGHEFYELGTWFKSMGGIDPLELLFPIMTLAAFSGIALGLLPHPPRRWREIGVSYATGYVLTFLTTMVLLALDFQV